MDFFWNFPLFSIVLSLFSGVLCMVLKPKAARYYTIIYQCFLIVLVSLVLWFTVTSGSQFTYPMGEFPAPWGNEIRGGVLEALVALIMLIVLLCSCTAGWHFLVIDIDESKINLYFSIINLLTAALMSLVWTNDIFTGYVFLEILTLTSCGILIVREIGRTTLAAVRYMVLNLLGSGLFLLGVVLLYSLTGHLLMVPMRAAVAEETPVKLCLRDRIKVIGLHEHIHGGVDAEFLEACAVGEFRLDVFTHMHDGIAVNDLKHLVDIGKAVIKHTVRCP